MNRKGKDPIFWCFTMSRNQKNLKKKDEKNEDQKFCRFANVEMKTKT